MDLEERKHLLYQMNLSQNEDYTRDKVTVVLREEKTGSQRGLAVGGCTWYTMYFVLGSWSEVQSGIIDQSFVFTLIISEKMV